MSVARSYSSLRALAASAAGSRLPALRSLRTAGSPAAAGSGPGRRRHFSRALEMQGQGGEQVTAEEAKHLPEDKKRELDQRARQVASDDHIDQDRMKRQLSSSSYFTRTLIPGLQGETVVKGGTSGKSLEAQIHLAEGKPAQALGVLRRSKGGQTRAEELGPEGYHEMGKKGGLSSSGADGGERAAQEGIPIDESKFTK
eukprot:SM000003S11225  [mRNA]  locus=s3:1597879:1598736:+ [translate_table: standard]